MREKPKEADADETFGSAAPRPCSHVRLRAESLPIQSYRFSGPARGQTPATSLPELAVLVGAQVEVVESSGSTVKGRLVEASEAGLLIDIDGKNVRLSAVRIREVSRRVGDPLWNGALIGAAIGAAFVLRACSG